MPLNRNRLAGHDRMTPVMESSYFPTACQYSIAARPVESRRNSQLLQRSLS